MMISLIFLIFFPLYAIIEQLFSRTGHFSNRKEAISQVFHRVVAADFATERSQW